MIRETPQTSKNGIRKIDIQNLHHSFGDLKLYSDFSLTFQDGEITAVLGPSGCGKTTLLHFLAGLLKPDEGQITGVDPDSLSYLFQEPRLLPWKTVYQNLELVIRDKVDPLSQSGHIHSILKTVELLPFKDYYPARLSGGMRQRAAIARAFLYPSTLMLLDEPFQALDLQLRLNLMSAFLRLWKKDRRTALFVTHDVQEALLIGDHIVLLEKNSTGITKVGRHISNPLPLEQRKLGSPQLAELQKELYESIFTNQNIDFL